MSPTTFLFALWLTAAIADAPAADAQATRLVILVRHAEAGGEPERDPPLTALGRERAVALAAALAHTEVGTIIVSGLQRTRLTAERVARARGITPVVAETSGGLAAHVEAVAAAVRAAPNGHAVLVVGHSNTVSAVIRALGGPELSDLCHGEFATLFVVQLRDDEPPRVIRARYGPPDEGCSAVDAPPDGDAAMREILALLRRR